METGIEDRTASEVGARAARASIRIAVYTPLLGGSAFTVLIARKKAGYDNGLAPLGVPVVMFVAHVWGFVLGLRALRAPLPRPANVTLALVINGAICLLLGVVVVGVVVLTGV